MTQIVAQLSEQKVAIYIRVSTQLQVDKDSLSVQKRELIAYCQLVFGIQDYVIFEDPGYSAKNTDRPAYQEMMARIRTGEFSHLMVWKIDRISRNLLDFAQMYAELKDLGVVFVSKNEQFDTSTAIGEAMLKIILVFAELERKMTAERVTAVMLSRANNGQWNGGRVPYGYSYDKSEKQFTINPEEAKVYHLVCDLYEDKQSLIYVSRHLNESGYRTRKGSLWTPTTIHKLLTNVFYTGSYRYNVHKEGTGYKRRDKEEWITIENHHPALIDDVRYDRFCFLLKRNARGGVKPGDTYVKKNVHIFGGLIRCGICGSNMTATLDRKRANGWRPSIYGCSTRRKSSDLCKNKYITDVTLGPFVFNYLANILRIRNSVTQKTTTETLEKKLLRGPIFSDIDHINHDDLDSILSMLQSGTTGMEFKPVTIKPLSEDSQVDERQILEERRRKDENALNRLKSLYLYGDDNLPEKDYILERQRIIDDMNRIDSRLSEIVKDSANDLSLDSSLLEQASYFIMVDQLLSDRYVDYEKYIRSIDPSIPRSFLHSVISKIEVADGRVTSIHFKNGLTNRFIYKNLI